MSLTRQTQVTLGLAALLVVAGSVGAQGLPERLSVLDPNSRSAIAAIVDSARTAGVPAEPLLRRALEGVTKHADGVRIVSAVRAWYGDLSAARTSLGAGSTEGEMVAGASAVRAGATQSVLAKLRAARKHESLTVPLSVLADLVASGVPAEAAANAVLSLASAGAPDVQFAVLSRNVQRDILRGATPTIALLAREKGMPAGSLPLSPSAVGNADAIVGGLGSSKAPTGQAAPRKP